MKKIKTFENFINESSEVSEGELVGLLVHNMSVGDRGTTFEMDTESGVLCFAPSGGASVDVIGNINIENVRISNIVIEEYECCITFDNGEEILVSDETGGEGLDVWWHVV